MKKWVLWCLASLLGFSLASCGGGSESFSPTSYAGTLNGNPSGTFNYTVTDANGNASGTAKVGTTNYQLAGYTTGDGTVNLQFQGGPSSGWITGKQSGGTMTGSWNVGTASGTVGASQVASNSGGNTGGSTSGTGTGSGNGTGSGGTGTGTGSGGTAVDCDTNTSAVHTISGSADLPLAACKAKLSNFPGFIWGTDAGATHGTRDGSCLKAKDNAFNHPSTACYCYTAQNVGSASALSNGDWICWVGDVI